MRKIEGLKFLQQYFNNLTVDCLFVDKVENLTDEALYKKDEMEQIWRARAGRKVGSELNLPQGTFDNPDELRAFIRGQSQRDADMQFVIHRVSPKYFTAPFVGTLAVYNEYRKPGIRIELQKTTKELVDSIDKGKRPRDWEACLILDYDFLSKAPKVRKRDKDLDMEFVKYPLMVIHEVGEEIFKLYEQKGEMTASYTRFNIYNLGQVVLDDHRSSESFVPKCACPTISKSGLAEAVASRQKSEEWER